MKTYKKTDITKTTRRHGGGTVIPRKRNAISRALAQPILHGRLRVKPAMTALLFVALFLSTCTSESFNKRTVIPEAEWRQEDRVAFDVDINDTISPYRFGIGLRHLENYRYSNLFVFLHTRMPNGNVTHDTIECTLATPEGRWIGKSSGSMRDRIVPLNDNLFFPMNGTYHFEIEQAMREPVLKGISDIGLYIEKQ